MATRAARKTIGRPRQSKAPKPKKAPSAIAAKNARRKLRGRPGLVTSRPGPSAGGESGDLIVPRLRARGGRFLVHLL